MNLETKLDERLWQAIRSKYEGRDFTGAILDAIYFLSDLIREKTGLECDGVALAGQAFGGKTPKLRINKLQTESERNIQTGIEQLIRGLYQAIRNPRSHGRQNDKEDDADQIVLFINYLLHIIDQSKAPFTKSEFMTRIFDVNFVENERYAGILASEVPPKYRLEVIVGVFHNRETGDGKKLSYFVNALYGKLSKEEKRELYTAVSDELRNAENDSQIRSTIQIFPDDFLGHLNDAARIRTENKLLQSIKVGKYDVVSQKIELGALGTWAARCCKKFLLKKELISILAMKLSSYDEKEQSYVLTYLWKDLVSLGCPPARGLETAIKGELKRGNKALYDKVVRERDRGNMEWADVFKNEIESFKESAPREEFPAEDDVPF